MHTYLFIIIALSLLSQVFAQSCKPYYIRIFYHNDPDPDLKVNMKVKYSTKHQCKDSYVEVNYLKSQTQFKCPSSVFTIPSDTLGTPAIMEYLHQCDIQLDSSQIITTFKYRIVGGNLKEEQSQFFTIELHNVQYSEFQENDPFIIIVASNINTLDDTTYLPLASAFEQLKNRREQQIQNEDGQNSYRINGIVLNGGLFNNISSNQGLNYMKIMQMVSLFSADWPIMLNISPDEISNKKDLNLIQRLFNLGNLNPLQSTRTPVQLYKFPHKANLIFLETSTQFKQNSTQSKQQLTRSVNILNESLAGLISEGNQFNIIINYYPISCDYLNDKAQQECSKGLQNIQPLIDVIQSKTQLEVGSADLLITARQPQYYRLYPFKGNQFIKKQNDIYNAGQLISINEASGGRNINLRQSLNQKNQVIQSSDLGFGMLTIKGKSNRITTNATTIQMQKNRVQYIIETQKKASSHWESTNTDNILNEAYIESQNLHELSLFLVNYKHITVAQSNLKITDIFRIVKQSENKARRHLLYASH